MATSRHNKSIPQRWFNALDLVVIYSSTSITRVTFLHVALKCTATCNSAVLYFIYYAQVQHNVKTYKTRTKIQKKILKYTVTKSIPNRLPNVLDSFTYWYLIFVSEADQSKIQNKNCVDIEREDEGTRAMQPGSLVAQIYFQRKKTMIFLVVELFYFIRR